MAFVCFLYLDLVTALRRRKRDGDVLGPLPQLFLLDESPVKINVDELVFIRRSDLAFKSKGEGECFFLVLDFEGKPGLGIGKIETPGLGKATPKGADVFFVRHINSIDFRGFHAFGRRGQNGF